MTLSAQLRALAAKEARALFPLWAACLSAGLVAPTIRGGVFHDFSVIAFGGGIVALGAYSVGHEYIHRTLGALLTMPADRWKVFAVKLAVLGGMVAPLAIYASLRNLCAPELPAWLIAGSALCLAPALTMICRNTLGGMMLSVSFAGTLLVAVMLLVAGPWDPVPELVRAAFVTWSRLMVVVFAGGALFSWRLFNRLKWIESGVEIPLPWQAASQRPVAPTHPIWQQVKKELRLQRLSFAVAALYVVASVAEAALRLVRPYDVPFLAPAAAGYWLCVPVLAGSVASADERQLGTLSSQVLLPVPAWQQWAAKAGTAFGLALMLGIAVPSLMLPLLRVDEALVRTLPALPAAVILTFALSATGLYVSSLSRSGVAAALASFGAIVVCLWIAERFAPGGVRLLLQRPLVITRGTGSALAALAAAAALLLRLAFVNHQSDQPGGAPSWLAR